MTDDHSTSSFPAKGHTTGLDLLRKAVEQFYLEACEAFPAESGDVESSPGSKKA